MRYARMRLGLTGGIGSGKSTVASMLVRLGADLVDTDAISRALTAAGGAALPALRAAFGPSVVAADGALDRAAMRALVFADAAARQRLEAVLHPMIGAEARRQSDASSRDVIVFDIPLLAESAMWRTRVDHVLVVDCRLETQIERVAARPGWTRETATQAIAAQASRAARRAIADAVIFNDDISLNALQAQTESLWRLWNNGRVNTAPLP